MATTQEESKVASHPAYYEMILAAIMELGKKDKSSKMGPTNWQFQNKLRPLSGTTYQQTTLLYGAVVVIVSASTGKKRGMPPKGSNTNGNLVPEIAGITPMGPKRGQG
ncbi:hypothetical protein MA16_Dca001645 [Dendrobium catenatum]|uniref:Uncharacterized protein n=1 Tax=Dendrobium catenatum TaxID=906689 RepID=A0A2I0WN02_9ASPA|nr:hypothetical protein MA16_Dca001645 [Dendrobium catenatum]